MPACQENESRTPVALNPPTSHNNADQKTVIVPPYVKRRWAGVKIAVVDKTHATENIYTVPINGRYQIPSSKLTIIVEAFLPSFVMEGTSMTSSSNEPRNPGVKVHIEDNGEIVYDGWLFLKFPTTHAVTNPKYGFNLVAAVPIKQ